MPRLGGFSQNRSHISFHSTTTLHQLNACLRSHAVDGAQYQFTVQDLSLHRNHVSNNNENYGKAY